MRLRESRCLRSLILNRDRWVSISQKFWFWECLPKIRERPSSSRICPRCWAGNYFRRSADLLSATRRHNAMSYNASAKFTGPAQQVELRTGTPYANLISNQILSASALAEHFNISPGDIIPSAGTTGAIEAVRNH